MCPVLDAMGLQPFLLRSGTHKSFEIASWMQYLAAPVGGREQRRYDLVPLRRARLVIVVVHRMRCDLGTKIGAVSRKFRFRQSLRTAHQLAVRAAALSPFAGAVLNRLDLHVVPVFPEGREHATVMRHVAVPVGS